MVGSFHEHLIICKNERFLMSLFGWLVGLVGLFGWLVGCLFDALI